MTSAPVPPPANGIAAAQPPALFPAKLPLLRPKHGRWIAGVARGIGMHLGVHVAWVRLAFALSCFAYGAGAIAYVALWVLVPPGDPVAEAARRVRLAQSAGAANAPLSRGNTPYGTPRSPEPVPDNPYDYTGLSRPPCAARAIRRRRECAAVARQYALRNTPKPRTGARQSL